MNPQAQFSGAVDNERPAYVEFEDREVEDRAQSIIQGHYVAKQRPIAVITRPGSRDSLEKWADEWLVDIREKARKGAYPMQWYQAYDAKFKEWQSGISTEGLEGTPLATWPPMGKALLKTFISAGVRTVEDLAQIPDADLQNLGTGSVGMKQKAKLWLEQASSQGKITEKLNDLTNKVEALVKLTQEQAQQLKVKDELLAVAAAQNPALKQKF